MKSIADAACYDEGLADIRDYVRNSLQAHVDTILEWTPQAIERTLEQMADAANRGCGQSYELFLMAFSASIDSRYPENHVRRVQVIDLAQHLGGYASPAEREAMQDSWAESGDCCHGLPPECCPCGCGDIEY